MSLDLRCGDYWTIVLSHRTDSVGSAMIQRVHVRSNRKQTTQQQLLQFEAKHVNSIKPHILGYANRTQKNVVGIQARFLYAIEYRPEAFLDCVEALYGE